MRWTKDCIHSFPKNGDQVIAKNYRGITLTSIAAMIYIALLLTRIELKIEKILGKNQNGFQRNRSTKSQILTIRWILEVRSKKLEATLLFLNFSTAFDSIHRKKMEQILWQYTAGWPADLHYLNQQNYSWPLVSSSCFSHLWPGVFHIPLPTHKIHNRKSRRKEEQTITGFG